MSHLQQRLLLRRWHHPPSFSSLTPYWSSRWGDCPCLYAITWPFILKLQQAFKKATSLQITDAAATHYFGAFMSMRTNNRGRSHGMALSDALLLEDVNTTIDYRRYQCSTSAMSTAFSCSMFSFYVTDDDTLVSYACKIHRYDPNFLVYCSRCLRSFPVVRPAVQLLQIQEVLPVPHSNACNFLPFLSIFSYLSYLGHLSLLGLQTKTRR